MTFIILFRNPTTDKLHAIVDDESAAYSWDRILEFKTEEEAHSQAEKSPVCRAWDYEVIEVSDPT